MTGLVQHQRLIVLETVWVVLHVARVASIFIPSVTTAHHHCFLLIFDECFDRAEVLSQFLVDSVPDQVAGIQLIRREIVSIGTASRAASFL